MKNIFETFNARYLSIEQVAKSFIPNKDFERLYQSSHSILMGPRGCGKTTLFKMLTPKAISIWKSNNADVHKNKIDFFGVYIPADKQWARQLKNFQDKFKDDNFQKIITKCIITTNVLNSIIDTFDDLLEVYIIEEQKRLYFQTLISKELIDIWSLKPPISPSFFGVRKSLSLRIRDINSIINKVEFDLLHLSDLKWEDYFFHNYIDLASAAFDVFEGVLKSDPLINIGHFKWALCFDELEIVPTWVTNEILDLYLRSTYQKILFKLATAPILNWNNEYNLSKLSSSAQNKHDFSIIRSWVYNYQSRKDWEEFCSNFISSKIQMQFDYNIDLQKLFGKHNLNNALKESEKNLGNLDIDESSDFQLGSLMYVITRKLAQQDSSFYFFLNSKNIDPTNPVPGNLQEVDAIFRKIKPAIVYRYYFFKRSSLRSRKAISLYHGYPFISELTDGNPRVLINLLSIFLNQRRSNIVTSTQIPLKAQGNIIQNFSTEFFIQITNHPEAAKYVDVNGVKTLVTLRHLLEMIGNWFYYKLVKAPFKMDSVNCFSVDKKVPPPIISLIKLAVELGAVQFLVDNTDVVLSDQSIINGKFRLSYILYPHFKLPKRTDNTISLNLILNETLYKVE
jgi:hypothetical protein